LRSIGPCLSAAAAAAAAGRPTSRRSLEKRPTTEMTGQYVWRQSGEGLVACVKSQAKMTGAVVHERPAAAAAAAIAAAAAALQWRFACMLLEHATLLVMMPHKQLSPTTDSRVLASLKSIGMAYPPSPLLPLPLPPLPPCVAPLRPLRRYADRLQGKPIILPTY
jgi:hypothetical protein